MKPPVDPSAAGPAPADAALAAALQHLATTQAALAAALGSAPAGVAAPADSPPGSLAFVAQLAGRALQPWADRRPWTLVALAAAGGALLATRRGRGLVGAVVTAALFAPAPGRLGARWLGRALGGIARRPAGPPR